MDERVYCPHCPAQLANKQALAVHLELLHSQDGED